VGVQTSDVDYVEVRVLLRSKVSDGLEAFLDKNAKLDAAILKDLKSGLTGIPLTVLRRALAHRDSQIRSLAFSEIFRRGDCDIEVAESALRDPDPNIILLGFRQLIQLKKSISEDEILAAFKGKILPLGLLSIYEEGRRSDHIDVAVGLSYGALSDDELKQKLTGRFPHVAYQLAIKRDLINIDETKEDIREGFASIKKKAPTGEDTWSPVFLGFGRALRSVKSKNSDFLRAALEGIAERAHAELPAPINEIISDGDSGVLVALIDLLRKQRNLTDEGVAALIGLVRDHSIDRAQDGRMVGDEAIKLLARLKPDVANELLRDNDLWNGAKAKVFSTLHSNGTLIVDDDLLLSLLRKESDDLRAVAIGYIREKVPRDRYALLIDRYMGEGLYYFDSLAEFDKLLYCPREIAEKLSP
jgi:hypothetical protein